MNNIRIPSHYQVIELRRYRTVPGARGPFVECFESWFPEAFQQLGAMLFGQFYERERADGFAWLRGYEDMDDRKSINEAFYYGPVWNEHKAAINRMLIDSDDVLLLTPLHADSCIPSLRAVDPVHTPAAARGIVLAQLFKIKDDCTEAAIAAAENWFSRYHGRGIIEAGILTTLAAANNFPQHPVREDGPWLVWLGVLRDEAALAALRPQCDAAATALAGAGLLDGPPELLVLDPTPRSRLRWAPATAQLELAA